MRLVRVQAVLWIRVSRSGEDAQGRGRRAGAGVHAAQGGGQRHSNLGTRSVSLHVFWSPCRDPGPGPCRRTPRCGRGRRILTRSRKLYSENNVE